MSDARLAVACRHEYYGQTESGGAGQQRGHRSVRACENPLARATPRRVAAANKASSSSSRVELRLRHLLRYHVGNKQALIVKAIIFEEMVDQR